MLKFIYETLFPLSSFITDSMLYWLFKYSVFFFFKCQVLEAENKNYNFESKGKPAEIFHRKVNDAVQFVGGSFSPSGGL